MSKQNGYSSIPDVEVIPASQLKQQKYPENFTVNQLDLMKSLDSAIANGESFELPILPAMNPNELQTQGKSYCSALAGPTVTAVGMTAVAWFLESEQESALRAEESASAWITTAIKLFPYISALIVGWSALKPIQDRIMAAVEPLFAKVHQSQGAMEQNVRKIGPTADGMIDSIQVKFHKVMERIQPTLVKANEQEKLVQQALQDDDLNVIPDPDSVDREIDEAQGMIGIKVKQVEANLPRVQDYIPSALRSPKAFYWRAVFPCLVVSIILQLVFAFVTVQTEHSIITTSKSADKNMVTRQSSIPDCRRRLVDIGLLSADKFNITEHHKDTTHEYYDEISKNIYKNANHASLRGCHRLLLEIPLTMSKMETTETQHSDTSTEYYDEISKPIYKNAEANATHRGSYYKNLTASNGNDAMDSALNQFSVSFDGAEEEHNETRQPTTAEGKAMFFDVLISYLIALLQLGLVYHLTSPSNKILLLKKAMSSVSDAVNRKLREAGVKETYNEVLVVRMGRVRTKVLKMINIYHKVNAVLGKADEMENMANGAVGLMGKH